MNKHSSKPIDRGLLEIREEQNVAVENEFATLSTPPKVGPNKELGSAERGNADPSHARLISSVAATSFRSRSQIWMDRSTSLFVDARNKQLLKSYLKMEPPPILVKPKIGRVK
jgi:hypothetical protein